jgi:tetratricopeptide (TPR) repeat protein
MGLIVKWRLGVLFTLMVILVTGKSVAQDTVMPLKLHVSYYVDVTNNQTRETARNFLNLIHDKMQALGVDVIYTNNQFPWYELASPSDYSLIIEFDSIYESIAHRKLLNTLIYIRPIKSQLASVSPILTEYWGDSRYWFDPGIQDWAVGMFLYSAEKCDQAIFHLGGRYKANCALVEGQYQTAISLLETYIDYDEWHILVNPLPSVNLAWAYYKIGKKDKAYDLMGEVIKTSQTNHTTYNIPPVDAYSRRAQLYALAEHYNDAITDLTTAIDQPSADTPDLYLLRGKMYLAQYEWDSALADYDKAIELDPDYADVYYERGVLYYSILHLREEALADFQQYITLAPGGDHTDDAVRYADQIRDELGLSVG